MFIFTIGKNAQRIDKVQRLNSDSKDIGQRQQQKYAPIAADRLSIEPSSTRFSGVGHTNYGYRPRKIGQQVRKIE